MLVQVKNTSGEIIHEIEQATGYFPSVVMDAITKGISLINADLSGNDLQGISFKELDLTGIDFSNCNLSGCNFEHSIICNAIFIQSNCEIANFKHANLTRANFMHAHFKKTNFSRANLDFVKFTRANFWELCNFTNAKMTNVFAQYATFRDVIFHNTDCQNSDFAGVKWIATVLTDCVNLKLIDVNEHPINIPTNLL